MSVEYRDDLKLSKLVLLVYSRDSQPDLPVGMVFLGGVFGGCKKSRISHQHYLPASYSHVYKSLYRNKTAGIEM